MRGGASNPLNERRSLLNLAALIGDADLYFLLTNIHMWNSLVNENSRGNN
jgi:hypothetical protein